MNTPAAVRRSRLRHGAITLCVAGLFLAPVLPMGAQEGATSGKAASGATLSGVPVGGKSRAEVERVATDMAARLLAYPISLRVGKQVSRTTVGGLGGTVNVARAVDVVCGPVDTGRAIVTIRAKRADDDGDSETLPLRLTEASAARSLKTLASASPRNARLTRVAGRWVSTPGKSGKVLDATAIADEVEAALNSADFRARLAAGLTEEPRRSRWLVAQPPLGVLADAQVVPARVTTDHLKTITATLATRSTALGSSTRNRTHNIELACKAIDGTVLLPGDVFSYNEIVGPRTGRAGFREAPVIIRGELQPGTGGGICQVSSTLYNAVLLADLQVVRRSHHAFPVPYLPAGLDATVAYGAIDFRFKNSLPHPIAVDAKVVGRRVVFHIYGHPGDKQETELVTSGVSRVAAGYTTVSDPKLRPGRRIVSKRPRDGQRVTVTRIVKSRGKVVRREVVSRDYYRPFSGVVRLGSRGASAPVEAPAPRAATPAPGRSTGG